MCHKTVNSMRIAPGKLVLIAVCSFIFAFPAFAQENAGSSDATATPEETKAEKAQQGLTRTVQRTANSIDNFFSTDRHVWGDNKTRITLRGNADYLDDHGWEFSPEVRFFLALPGMNFQIYTSPKQIFPSKGDPDELSGTASMGLFSCARFYFCSPAQQAGRGGGWAR
jgi:hypothetical protein